MKNKNVSKLTLRGLELNVHLGWPQAERLQEQSVMLDIDIQFANPPLACTTDNIKDTYCYDALINTLTKNIAEKKFRLLEHLGHDVFQIIKQSMPTDALVHIKVTKHPSIPNLTGGVSFHYGDI